MATHQIPRNVKGEGRILYIFSTKALIYTVIGGILGYFVYLPISIIKSGPIVTIIVMGIFALIGFSIATFKMPESANLEITRKTGGEYIDEVIFRYIKFKAKKNRIYVYTKEEKE